MSMFRRKFIISTILICLFTVGLCEISSAEGADLFSDLSLSEIAIKGHKLHIKGSSDLPPGSVINFKWHFPGFNNKGNKVKIHVNNNRFFVKVDLPFKGKKHGETGLFSLIFNPLIQSEKVKARVGIKGEKLAGAKVRKNNGVNVLEEIRIFNF